MMAPKMQRTFCTSDGVQVQVAVSWIKNVLSQGPLQLYNTSSESGSDSPTQL